jgi:membrane-associated protease RseP (regulator of RpoE activity)
VFVAVLLHELAHAVVARRAGFTPVIDLHALGATTSWTSPFASAWSERLAIDLAGPIAGFLVAAVAGVVRSALGDGSGPPSVPGLLLHDLLWASVGWSVLNVLPMLPLDGGQAFETILGLQNPGAQARRLALTVSCGTAGVAALVALILGLPVVALLCAALGYDDAAQLYGLPTVHQRI